MRRRHWLIAAASLGLARAVPANARTARLAAAWEDGAGRHFAGLLRAVDDAALQVEQAVALPTRAHGLWVDGDGSLLVVARRPGDWLLRWRPDHGQPQWRWSEPDRRLCGHVVATGGRLYGTETDLASGAGLVVVREARSLEPIAEWRTAGIDAHELLLDGAGGLLVANGGVPTRPETGRLKLERSGMDPSLVRLGLPGGALTGQWRLPDARLSIRHLARHGSGRVGIALQAEHDEAEVRAEAPLLALFDGQALRTAAQPRALAGYAGSIVATRDGFAVAATRAGGLARWRSDGGWQSFTPLVEACPLAVDETGLWSGGREQALHGRHAVALPALRLDNHWSAWRA